MIPLLAESHGLQLRQFDLIVVLIGAFLTMSISKIAGFAIGYVTNRSVCRPGLVPTLFLLALFCYQLYYWWSLFEIESALKSPPEGGVKFTAFLALIALPLSMYGATAVLCPRLESSTLNAQPEKECLATKFNENCRPFYALMCFLFLCVAFQGWFFWEESIFTRILRIGGAGLFLVGFFFKNRVINYILASITLCFVFANIFVAVHIGDNWLPEWLENWLHSLRPLRQP